MAGPTTTNSGGPAAPITASAPRRLVETLRRSLPSPVEDAGAAAVGGDAYLLAGLDDRDVSVAGVVRIAGGERVATLPQAIHDAPAVALGKRLFVFGGGDGAGQRADIVAIDPITGRTAIAGHLPAASSDAGAAVAGRLVYIVGGFTGTRWLDTIVAWRPGVRARIVARLPNAIRYPAVAAAGGEIVIAGGTKPDGTATRDVLRFDPATGRVAHASRLPAATTHAAAATLPDGRVLVIGGRGAKQGTQVDAIVAVDLARHSSLQIGRLRRALSDAAAVVAGGRVLVAGGRTRDGAIVADVGALADSAAAGGSPVASAPPPDIYAASREGLTGAARRARPLVYVPNGTSGTVVIIDQRTLRVIRRYQLGGLPQHVTPSWDFRTLWVSLNSGNAMQAFNPRTGRPRGRPIPVEDPYNLYYTLDGRSAIVVEERNNQLSFRDPHSWHLQRHIPVPCRGVDHLDFSPDGSFLVASCEFSGDVVRVPLREGQRISKLHLPGGAMPQDVKLTPDGRFFYVADMTAGGVFVLNASGRRRVGFVRTGAGAHGLYPSRDSRYLYVTNRGAGTVSVLRLRDRRVVRNWQVPGGSPDMGGLSADGRTLWLSGRYNDEVYAINTSTGRVLARIPVDHGPHGLAVWPQPGRFSLGHTGILR